MYIIYSLLYISVLLFFFPKEYFKRQNFVRYRWIKEKFGFFDPQPKISSNKRIWIHAVSVGEVMACVPLIRQLHNQYSDIEIILSTITDTGQKIAIEKLGDIAKIIFLPFDLPFCINKALKNIKPDIFILIETELWPNFIKILNKKGIPILVLNGRISEKSFNGYKKIKYFIKDVLNNINLFCMQNDLYSLRIKELGVSPNKILTLGNIKFDKELDLQTLKWTKILKTSDKKNSNLVIVAMLSLPLVEVERTLLSIY